MTGRNLKISILSYFYISFVLDGLQRLSGLFVLELLQSMRVSHQNAAVPFIFSWAVANIMASFSDIFIESKKSEYILLFGILLTATGAALCVLATNITALIVFWGIIFGSGYGLASPHLSSRLKSVNSSKLSFILQVTPSLGVTIMPFVLYILTSYYGLQGSYLIISGIILNYLPLSVAAAYNIELRIPNIKWRVRKRSSEYFVSKQARGEIISHESFVNSLEPDLIRKIHQNDECRSEVKINSYRERPLKEVITIGRKRSETRGNDLQGLEMNPRIFPRNKTHSDMSFEVQKYEKVRKAFEGSFSNKDIVYEVKKKESETSGNCDRCHSDIILEKKNLNTSTKGNLNLKNKTQNQKRNTESEKKCLESSMENIPGMVNTNLQIRNKKSNTIIMQRDKEREKKKEHETSRTGNGNLSLLSLKKCETKKTTEKENIQLTPNHLEYKPLNVPMDIKVYVEELTFTSDEEYLCENLNIESRKSSYRNNSNSMLPKMYENMDLTKQNFLKCSELRKPKLSSIYSISESLEFNDNRKTSKEKSNSEKEENKSKETTQKIKRIFKFFNEVTSLVCLCIILIAIIFEINLVTLITMFADISNDVDNDCSDFKWILVAFGAGGLVGKFCCCKISRTIPEKSHAIGVVLFLLTALSTAGILFSPNLNWLAGFYGILGALEDGITYIIPKFIFEYTNKSIHSTLSSAKSFSAGAAILCIPYVIGLFRDELGDYEFLLQTLSCSSVFCAFLAYFLPYLSTASNQ